MQCDFVHARARVGIEAERERKRHAPFQLEKTDFGVRVCAHAWMCVHFFQVHAEDAGGAASRRVSAGCCSVLQSVAECCRVLQCVSVCCSVLQCVAVCCICVAVCRSVLQCLTGVAVRCSVSHNSRGVAASLRLDIKSFQVMCVCCLDLLYREWGTDTHIVSCMYVRMAGSVRRCTK